MVVWVEGVPEVSGANLEAVDAAEGYDGGVQGAEVEGGKEDEGVSGAESLDLCHAVFGQW